MARGFFVSSESDNRVIYSRDIWLSKRTPEITRWAYIEAIKGFKQSVKIVAGEANGKLFDREDFADALRTGLRENPKAKVKIVFHKDDDKDKARLAFKDECPHLAQVKRDFLTQVYIYWAPKRARQHYAVVDEERIVFEQPNHQAEKPFWGNIVIDDYLGREWEDRFDEYVRYCSELQY